MYVHQGTHLETGEEVDRVARVLDPHVQSLTLLHDDAWGHEGAVGVPQATLFPLRNGMQLWQKLP